MKIRDESEWQGWLAELAQDDDPISGQFRDFMVDWADRAEPVLSEYQSPGGALNAVLDDLLQAHGWVSSLHLGLALVALCTYWDYGGTPEDFAAGLTPLEQHLFLEVANLKISLLQQEAASTNQEES